MLSDECVSVCVHMTLTRLVSRAWVSEWGKGRWLVFFQENPNRTDRPGLRTNRAAEWVNDSYLPTLPVAHDDGMDVRACVGMLWSILRWKFLALCCLSHSLTYLPGRHWLDVYVYVLPMLSTFFRPDRAHLYSNHHQSAGEVTSVVVVVVEVVPVDRYIPKKPGGSRQRDFPFLLHDHDHHLLLLSQLDFCQPNHIFQTWGVKGRLKMYAPLKIFWPIFNLAISLIYFSSQRIVK